MCGKAEENNLAIRNWNDRLMEGVRKAKILNSEGAQVKNEFKQDRQNAILDRWSDKKWVANSYSRCLRQSIKLRPGSGLGKLFEIYITGTLIFAAQEQTLRTNYVKFNIDKSVESNLCGQKGKTINHIVSECKYLAQE